MAIKGCNAISLPVKLERTHKACFMTNSDWSKAKLTDTNWSMIWSKWLFNLSSFPSLLPSVFFSFPCSLWLQLLLFPSSSSSVTLLFKSGRNYCLNLFNQRCKSKDVTAILLLIFSWRTRRVSHSLTWVTYTWGKDGTREEKFQREEMSLEDKFTAKKISLEIQYKYKSRDFSFLSFSLSLSLPLSSSLSLPREDKRRKASSSRMIYLRWRALLFYFSRSQNDESKSCHQIKSLSLRERDFLNFSSKKLLGKKNMRSQKMESFWTIRFPVSFWLTKKNVDYDYFDSSSIYHLSMIILPSTIYPSLITLVIIHSKKDDTQSILHRPVYIFCTSGKKRFVSLPHLFIDKEKAFHWQGERNRGLICCWFIGFTYSRSICRCHPSF